MLHIEFGRRVKAVRILFGWDQKELSKQSGLDTAIISRIENGWLTPQPAQRQAIHDAFGMDLSRPITIAPPKEVLAQ